MMRDTALGVLQEIRDLIYDLFTPRQSFLIHVSGSGPVISTTFDTPIRLNPKRQ
jgi:hypothetical protein